MTYAPRRPGGSPDRGTSEVVGFVLVFALVFAGVGAVYGAGFDTLSDARDAERLASAERGFVLLSEAVADVRSGSVRRTSTLALGDGHLALSEGPRIELTTDGRSRAIGTDVIGYVSDAGAVAYANGGVVRDRGGGGTVVTEPSLSCRPGRDLALVSVLTVRSGDLPASGDHVEVSFRPISVDVWRVDDLAVNVSGSRYADAWARHLQSDGWTDAGHGRYRCPADRAVVRRTTVGLSVDS